MFVLAAVFVVAAVVLMFVVVAGTILEERADRRTSAVGGSAEVPAADGANGPDKSESQPRETATPAPVVSAAASRDPSRPPRGSRVKVAYWAHMRPVFERSDTWRQRHSDLTVMLSHDELVNRLSDVLRDHGIVETPVYAYLSQLPTVGEHFVLARNYNAGAHPAQLYCRADVDRFPNGATIVDVGEHFRTLAGLRVSVLGELMSPTIHFLKELDACGVMWEFENGVSADGPSVVLVPHSQTDSQLISLIEGDVDVAQVVYPDTLRVRDDRNVRRISCVDRLVAHASIEGEVANVIICRGDLRESARAREILGFLQERNRELDRLQEPEEGAEVSRGRGTTGVEAITDTEQSTLQSALEFVTELTEHDRRALVLALEVQLAYVRLRLPARFPALDRLELARVVTVTTDSGTGS